MVELNLANTATASFVDFENTILYNLAKQNDTTCVSVNPGLDSSKNDITNTNNDITIITDSNVGNNLVTHNLEFDNIPSFAIVSNRINNDFIPIDVSYSSLLGSNSADDVKVTQKYVVKDSYYSSTYTLNYSRNAGPFTDTLNNWNIMFDASSSNVDLALAQNSQLHDGLNCLVSCELDTSNNHEYLAGNSLSSYFTRDLSNNKLIPTSIASLDNNAFTLSTNKLVVSLNANVGFSNVGMYKVDILDASYSSSFLDTSSSVLSTPYSSCWFGFGPDASYISQNTLVKDTSSSFKNMVDNNYKSVVSNFLNNTNGNLSLMLTNNGGGSISSPDSSIFTLNDTALIKNDLFMSNLYPKQTNQLSFVRGSLSLPNDFSDATVDFSLGEKLGNDYNAISGLIKVVVDPISNRITTILPNDNNLIIESSNVLYNASESTTGITNGMMPLDMHNMTASDVSYNLICKLKNTLGVTSRSSEIVFDNNELCGNVITDNLSGVFSSKIATQLNIKHSLTYYTSPEVGVITKTDYDNYDNLKYCDYNKNNCDYSLKYCDYNYSLKYCDYNTNDIDFMKEVVVLTKVFDIKDNNNNFQHVAIKLDNKTLDDFGIVFESLNLNWRLSLNPNINVDNPNLIAYGIVSRIDSYFPRNIPNFIKNNMNAVVRFDFVAEENYDVYSSDVYTNIKINVQEYLGESLGDAYTDTLLDSEISLNDPTSVINESPRRNVSLDTSKPYALSNAPNSYYVKQTEVITTYADASCQLRLATAINIVLHLPVVVIKKKYFSLYDSKTNALIPGSYLANFENFVGEFKTEISIADVNGNPIHMSFILNANMLHVLKGTLIDASDLNAVIPISSGFVHVDPLFGTNSMIQAYDKTSKEPSFKVDIVILPQSMPVNNLILFNHKHYFIRLNGSYTEDYVTTVYNILPNPPPFNSASSDATLNPNIDPRYPSDVNQLFSINAPNNFVTQVKYNSKCNVCKCSVTSSDGTKKYYEFNVEGNVLNNCSILYVPKDVYLINSLYVSYNLQNYLDVDNGVRVIISNSNIGDNCSISLKSDKVKVLLVANSSYFNPGLYTELQSITPARGLVISDSNNTVGSVTLLKYRGYVAGEYTITRIPDTARYSILNSSNSLLDSVSFPNLFTDLTSDVNFGGVGSIGLSVTFNYSILPQVADHPYIVNIVGDSIDVTQTVDGTVDGVVTQSALVNALDYVLYTFGNSSLKLLSTIVKSPNGQQTFDLGRIEGKCVLSLHSDSFIGIPSDPRAWSVIEQPFTLPVLTSNPYQVGIFNIYKTALFMRESSSYYVIAPPQIMFTSANNNISNSVYFTSYNAANLVTRYMDVSSNSQYNPFAQASGMNNIAFTHQNTALNMSNLTNVASQSPLVAQFAIPGTTLTITEDGNNIICDGTIDTLSTNDKLSVSFVNEVYTLRINRNPLELDIVNSSFDLVVTLNSAFYNPHDPTPPQTVAIASSGTRISFLSLIHNSNDVNDYKFYLVKYTCSNIFNWDYVINSLNSVHLHNSNLCDAFNTFLKTTEIKMQVKANFVTYTSVSGILNTLPNILKTINDKLVTGAWSCPEVLYTNKTDDTNKIKFKLIETSYEDAEKDLIEFLSFAKDKTLANALYITNNDV
jgi:hypothetical protein